MMKKSVLVLLLVISFSGCNNQRECCVYPPVELSRRFEHEISDCDNSGNAEMNCTEFLEINVNGQADLLYGGSDIVRRFKMRVNSNTIYLELEPTSSFALPFHFKILESKNLERSDNGDIWIKDN